MATENGPAAAPELRLDNTLALRDGRRIGYAEIGHPTGVPVLYCHGFPASRLESRLVAAAAARTGTRMIAPDRPGYGLSDWKAERAIPDWADDAAELADHLGLERFRVLGVSGGAPYALALACRLPRRVEAVGIVCGLGPVHRPDVLRPMHWPARLGFTCANTAPWLNRLFYGALVGPMMRARPETALALLTVGSREPDRRVLARPDVHATICASLREGLRPGMRGALLDMALYARAWLFDPAVIEAPVVFWHGEADATVPMCHTQLMAALMPRATVRLVPGEGHFSLPIDHADEILRTLLRL